MMMVMAMGKGKHFEVMLANLPQAVNQKKVLLPWEIARIAGSYSAIFIIH
jgi:hypothetical protein